MENIFTVQTILLFCLKNWPFSSNFTIRLHQVPGRRGTTTTTEQNPASETWVNFHVTPVGGAAFLCLLSVERPFFFLEWNVMKLNLTELKSKFKLSSVTS